MNSIKTNIVSYIATANIAGICGWLLIIRPVLYLLFSRRREFNAYATVDTSAFIFIVYAVVCFYFSIREINKFGSSFSRKLLFKSPLLWFVLYTELALFSMLWSVNFQLTGFRAFECFAMLTLIVAIMQKLFETHDFFIICKWTLFYVTTDIICSLIKTLSYTTDLSLLLQSSQMMATVFFFMALYLSQKKWYHYLILIMSIFSLSTTAYIGMALGGISIFGASQRYRVLVFISTVAFVFTVAIVGPYKFVKETIFFEKETISIHETSGRDKIMDVAIEALEKNPKGYGFFAGEPYLLRAKNLSAINGHNSLFSAAIGLGIAGIIIISLFFIRMFSCTFSRYIDSAYKPILIGCCMVAFFHCMGNPGLGSRVYGSWLPVMFLCALVCGFYVHGKYYSQDSDIE